MFLQTPSLKYQKVITAKKAKLKNDSGRSFKEGWTESFGLMEPNGEMPSILLCVAYSVRWHFDTNKSLVKWKEKQLSS